MMILNEIVGIVAPKGRGKTTLATRLALMHPRVAIFDLMADEAYAQIADDAVVANPREFAGAIRRENFRVLYRPSSYDTESRECPGLVEFLAISYARGDLWIILDEAHLLCTPWSIPAILKNAAMIGRHHAVSLAYITQSFSLIARALTLNTDTFVFFRITDPRDLQNILGRTANSEVIAKVRNLRVLSRLWEGEIMEWKQGESGFSVMSASSWRATPELDPEPDLDDDGPEPDDQDYENAEK